MYAYNIACQYDMLRKILTVVLLWMKLAMDDGGVQVYVLPCFRFYTFRIALMSNQKHKGSVRGVTCFSGGALCFVLFCFLLAVNLLNDRYAFIHCIAFIS